MRNGLNHIKRNKYRNERNNHSGRVEKRINVERLKRTNV